MKYSGIKWTLILGGFGFCIGFFGPMVLAPDANQGPLLGIFITGPLGFVSGLVLWMLSAGLGWSWQRQKTTAIVVCVLLALGVVAGSLAPKPEWVGRFYEIEVTSCRASVTEGESTLEVRILKERIIKKNKPLFRAESLVAFAIRTSGPQASSFYISGPCAGFPMGFRGTYFVTDHPAHSRDKALLEAIPESLKGL